MIRFPFNINPLKKISISAQLFINYLFLFIFLLLVLVLTSVIGAYNIDKHYESNEMGPFSIKESIDSYGLKKAFELHKLPEGSYIEVLDSKLTVIDQYNSSHNIGYTYPQSIFNRLALDHSAGYELYSSAEKDTIILIFNVSNSKGQFSIRESINSYGPKKAFELHKLPEGSYIEVLDSKLTVIDQYNSSHSIGYTYPQSIFNRLALNYSAGYELHYSTENDTITLIFNNNYSEANELKFFKRLYIYLLLFFVISVLLVLIIYAKLTSKTLVRPIRKILEGVKTISDGDYTSKINYKSRNELGYLIESINQMSEKIQHEMELREKSEANRKKLILDISHDLKTPLTNILGYSETLKHVKELDDDLRTKYLDIIISNSKKSNNLIQDLFELSHMENSNSDITLEDRDFSEFIREILGSYIPELDDNKINYDFDIPDKEIIVKMNPQKLERAINNIINNSIKYGKKNMSLKLRLWDSNNNVVLAIEDSGVGIPDELAENIFDPFVRADNSRNSKTGGTGLGLAISKGIIKIHGGSIKLDTSYKEGCRFIISIPKSN